MPKRAYQKSVDGESIIIPKELIESRPVEVSAKQFKEIVKPSTDGGKRPMSEAQRANIERLIAANKERKRIREEEKAKLKEIPEVMEKVVENEKKFREEVLLPARKEIKKEKEDALLAAGSHVKIVVKKRAPRKKVVEITETEDTDLTTDMSDTEDTDIEEYKTKARQVRKAAVAKKLVKTVAKIDRVIQQAAPVPTNPYTNMLASRWR